jgi:hypothetical protein
MSYEDFRVECARRAMREVEAGGLIVTDEALKPCPRKAVRELVERAYREAWHEGYATGDAGGSYGAVESDWLGSDARAAIARRK